VDDASIEAVASSRPSVKVLRRRRNTHLATMGIVTTPRQTDAQTCAHVRRAVQARGARAVAAELRISRGATLALAAGVARAGTIALARERLATIQETRHAS
jgi:hypothetical protein